MALAAALPLRAASRTFLPLVSAPTVLSSSRYASLYAQTISHPLLPTLSLAVPGVALNIPQLMDDLWGVLKAAVPKKKTSYSKKRKRFLTGKALDDVTSLCRCPACGQTKRMHRVCPSCLQDINQVWKKENKSGVFL